MVRVGSEDGSWFGHQLFHAAHVGTPAAQEVAILMHGARDPIRVRILATLAEGVRAGMTDVNGMLPAGKRWLVQLRGLGTGALEPTGAASLGAPGDNHCMAAKDRRVDGLEEGRNAGSGPEPDGLEGLTLAQLRALAAREGHALAGTSSRTRKADIVSALRRERGDASATSDALDP